MVGPVADAVAKPSELPRSMVYLNCSIVMSAIVCAPFFLFLADMVGPVAEAVVKPSELRRSMVYRPADNSWVDIPWQGVDYLHPELGLGPEEDDEDEEEEEDETMGEVQYSTVL